MQVLISFGVVMIENIGILGNWSETMKNKVMIWDVLSKRSFFKEGNGNIFKYMLSSFSSGDFSYKRPGE